MESSDHHQTKEGICVGIRIRPLNDREVSSGQQPIFRCLPQTNTICQVKDGCPVEGQAYNYDKVFDETSSTDAVYDYSGQAIVKGVANGINGTIFAYGQTSSGKTFTMIGAGETRGVLDLAAADLFRIMGERSDRVFLVRVSFVEIYNEVIRDLLSDASDPTVSIREDPRKGVYCEASEHGVTDYDSISWALKKGASRRTVESTAMNDTSSRSHTIFKLVVESKANAVTGVESDESVLVASLNLVDLAGSESVRHTGATGQRAKEGGKINQSLLSLSRVIHALSQPGQHVSYRDSKLTRLLQPSLSGNAKMSIICCITAAERYLEETRSTLQFASRAKLVVTHAVVNEVLDEGAQIRKLTKELNALKEKQSSTTIDEVEHNKLEAEKKEMMDRLFDLENEKNVQKAQLERLKSLIVIGSSPEKKRRKKKHRDTWCPGLNNGMEDDMVGAQYPLTGNYAARPSFESSKRSHRMICADNVSMDVSVDSNASSRLSVASSADTVVEESSTKFQEQKLLRRIEELEMELRFATSPDAVPELRTERIDDLELALEKKNDEIAQIKAEQEFAVEQLNFQHQENQDMRSTLANITEQFKSTQSELKRFEEAQDELVRFADSESELSAAREQVVTLETQLEAVTKRFEGAQAELARYTDSESELTAAREQVSALQSELEMAANQFEEAQAELARYADSESELAAAREQGSALESQMTKTARKFGIDTSIHIVGSGEKSLLEELSVCRSALADFEVLTESLRKDITRLNEELCSVAGRKDSEISRLLNALSNAQNAADTDHNSFKLLKESADSVYNSDEFLKKKVSQLQTEVGLLQGEKSNWQARSLGQDEKNKSQFIRLELLESKILEAERDLEDGKLVSSAERGEIRSLKVVLEKLQNDAELHNTDKAQLLSSLNASNVEVKRLQGVVEEYQTKLYVLSDASRIQTDLKAATAEINVLREEIGVKTAEVGELDVRAKKNKESQQLILHELERLNEEHGSVLEDLEMMKSEKDNLTVQLSSVQEMLVSEQLLRENTVTALQHMETKLQDAIATNENLSSLLQKKDDALRILSVQENTDDRQSNSQEEVDALLRELNCMMEQKGEVEAKLGEADADVRQYRQQLADYDRESTREQEALVEAAQLEMDRLRDEYESKINFLNEDLHAVQNSSSEFREQTEIEKALMIKNFECKVVELTESIRSEIVLREALQKELTEVHAHHQDELLAKDTRISHLEKSKLTVDQLERIQRVKIERKKYQDDAKSLKHQLIALKSAYEELQAKFPKSTGTVEVSPTVSYAEYAAVQAQLNESNMRLENSQGMVDVLKEKLKDCASQLRIYETEKQSVMACVDEVEVENTVATSRRGAEDSFSHECDMIDAVKIIVGKLKVLQKYKDDVLGTVDSLTVDLKEKNSSLCMEVLHLEAKLNSYNQRMEGEQKIAETLQGENVQLKEDIERMRLDLCRAAENLELVRSESVGDFEGVSSEIQTLQEENIELMQENKELRRRIAAHNSSQQTAAESAFSDDQQAEVVTSVTSACDDHDKKRVFGTVIDIASSNIPMEPRSDSTVTKTVGGAKKFRMKAKPLVAPEAESSLGRPTGSEVDTTGECAQS